MMITYLVGSTVTKPRLIRLLSALILLDARCTFTSIAELRRSNKARGVRLYGRRPSEASMYGYAYIQWKIALARMQDANMAEMTKQAQLTPPAARQIAEYLLSRYFEMVEARLPQFDAGQRCR
jgi:hypothetical protein